MSTKDSQDKSKKDKLFSDAGEVTADDTKDIPVITIGNASFIDVEIPDLSPKELLELIGDRIHLTVSKEVIENLSPELKKKIVAKGIIDKL